MVKFQRELFKSDGTTLTIIKEEYEGNENKITLSLQIGLILEATNYKLELWPFLFH